MALATLLPKLTMRAYEIELTEEQIDTLLAYERHTCKDVPVRDQTSLYNQLLRIPGIDNVDYFPRGFRSVAFTTSPGDSYLEELYQASSVVTNYLDLAMKWRSEQQPTAS